MGVISLNMERRANLIEKIRTSKDETKIALMRSEIAEINSRIDAITFRSRPDCPFTV